MATIEVTPEISTLEVSKIGMLCAMNEEGDARMQWDRTNSSEVAKAQARFDEYKKKGYLAYRVNKKGDRGVVLDTFDPSAERIIMAPPMVGG